MNRRHLALAVLSTMVALAAGCEANITPTPKASPSWLVVPPMAIEPGSGAEHTRSYVVGTDIPPGTYTMVNSVSSADCGWIIAKPGVVGPAGIIAMYPGPHNGDPVQLTVTLQAGQEFTDEGCGSWALVSH